MVPVLMGWANGKDRNKANGWTDKEMLTVTFATLQTLLITLIYQFLINYA
jgi:hypothetical protein